MRFEKTYEKLNGLDVFDMTNMLNQLPRGMAYRITIEQVGTESAKTPRQHNWFFLKRVKPLAKETGDSPQELYDAIKMQFGFDTTSNMTTKEFTDFVAMFDAWAAEYHNFTFGEHL